MKANWTRWVILPALFLLGIEAVQAQQGAPPPGRVYGPRPTPRQAARPAAYHQGEVEYAPGLAPPAHGPAPYPPAYGDAPVAEAPAYQAAPVRRGGEAYSCTDNCADGCDNCEVVVKPRPKLPHTYGTVQYMMAWTSGTPTPPLVTTSPAGTQRFVGGNPNLPNAGVLGRAGIPIFGGVESNKDMRNGGRLDAGVWLDECGTAAIGGRFLMLDPDRETFDEASDNGVRTLAVPFFDQTLAPPGENAFLVGYLDPATGDLFEGFINDIVEQSVLTSDLYLKLMMIDDEELRVDVLGGYFYGRVDDRMNLRLVSQQTAFAGVPAAGPVFDFQDRFRTTNEIHAGEIGLSFQRRWSRWTATTDLRCAFGVNTQNVRVTADGSNINGVPVTNGFFARNQILGSFTRHQFTMVPELDFTIGYWLTPHLQLTAGYTGMIFTNIAQSGDIFDRRVDPIGGPRPAFSWKDGEFWLQSINVGLAWDF